MPTELEMLQQASAKARSDYWATVGKVDHVSHQLLASRFFPGRPLWPSLRETFLVIHRDDKILVATDGLSDPDGDKFQGRNGHGLELFVEAPAIDLTPPTGTTYLAILTQVALNIASAGGQVLQDWKKYQVLSMEVPAQRKGLRLVSSAGYHVVLLGLPGFDTAPEIGNMPLSPVKTMAMTIVHPDDFDKVRSDGAAGRTGLGEALYNSGHRHVSDLRRTPVLTNFYQDLGREAIRLAKGSVRKLLLYAHVGEGFFSADIFFERKNDPVVYCLNVTDKLFELLHEVWENGDYRVAARSWAALRYEIEGKQFWVNFIDHEQFDAEDGWRYGRERAVAEFFPGAKVVPVGVTITLPRDGAK
jgi:hypothetical protein